MENKKESCQFSKDGINFRFDNATGLYDATFHINNQKINIIFHQNPKSFEALKSLNTLKLIENNFANFYQKIVSNCSKSIVNPANDWEKNTSSNPHQISLDEVEKRISSYPIAIEIVDENFTVYFEDDNMFLGHTIIYNGNINNNKFNVSIGG